jgi:hypothetical protein
MNQIIKFPQWVVTIFSLLCLVQVQHWFEELVTFSNPDKTFFWRGQRFTVLPNRSFIMDDSLKIYGIAIANNTLN